MTRPILIAIFLGWVTNSFSLYDVGSHSLTLLLLASVAMGAFALWGKPSSALPALLCLGASAVLGLCVSLRNDLEMTKPATHLIQSVIGLGVLAGSTSLDLKRQLPWLRRLILVLGGSVLLFGLYQLAARVLELPFAFLPITNLQLGADDGFQRGYSHALLAGGGVTRASSLFAEPSDMGRFMLWIIAFGYPCRERWLHELLLTVGITGILVSQSMSGLIGLGVLLLVIVPLQRDLGRLLFVGLLCVAVLAIALYLFPEIGETVGQRAASMLLDREDHLLQSGRFRDQYDNLQLFAEAPLLGHGLASVATVAADNIIGNSFALLLIERGLIGTALFLLPFLWYLFRLGPNLGARREAEQTAFALLVVEMYSFATFGAIYFGPIYLALGFAVSQAADIARVSPPAKPLPYQHLPPPHFGQLPAGRARHSSRRRPVK